MVPSLTQRISHIQYRRDLFSRPRESTAEFVQSPPWIAEHIADGLRRNILPRPAASVLDLGCGNGYAACLFAAHGYDAYGIDLQSALVERAQTAAEELARQDVLPGKTQFAVGNYLPQDVRARARKAPHVLLDASADPYAALGKRPQEFDVFFVYPFPGQMESVFDLFAHAARPGARLMALGDECDWDGAGYPQELIHLGTQLLAEDADDILNLRRSYTVYQKPMPAKQ